jgi:predicted transcriptional regulator
MASTGVTYGFLDCVLTAGLLQTVNMGKRRRRLMVTDRGREFMRHVKACTELFPETSLGTGQ